MSNNLTPRQLKTWECLLVVFATVGIPAIWVFSQPPKQATTPLPQVPDDNSILSHNFTVEVECRKRILARLDAPENLIKNPKATIALSTASKYLWEAEVEDKASDGTPTTRIAQCIITGDNIKTATYKLDIY